jgi:hypothetical protein
MSAGIGGRLPIKATGIVARRQGKLLSKILRLSSKILRALLIWACRLVGRLGVLLCCPPFREAPSVASSARPTSSTRRYLWGDQ